MSQHQLIKEWETKQEKKEIVPFAIGDTVDVHVRIVEGGKERIQVFNGIVIARKGSGIGESFSVYRNAYGSSMERVFLLHSPMIAKIEVKRRGKVRRAKLYYLRGKTGKAAKVEDLIFKKESKKKEKAAAPKDVDQTVTSETSQPNDEKPSPSEE